MTVPVLGGVNVPDSLKARGRYTFTPAQTRLSGAGTAYSYGLAKAAWVWPWCSQTEWDWLKTQWLAGPTTFTLWNDDNTLTASSGVMLRPTYEDVSNGLYRNVKVEFQALVGG